MKTKTLSTTWPWEENLSVADVIKHAKKLKCRDLCIRAVVGSRPYGLDDVTRNKWGGKTHQDLEREAKDAGLTLSIWCVFTLQNPPAEAAAIRDAVNLYRPTAVFLDAEGERFKQNAANNLGYFLRSLGRLPCPVYLQSYRLASAHREMLWQKWYTYKDEQTGAFIIDGLAHQLYPIKAVTVAEWVRQFKRDVQSHEKELQLAARPNMPWYPTLPTFVGGAFENAVGWKPPADAFKAALDWLEENLGERLIGVNFWSLDQDLIALPELHPIIAALKVTGGDEDAAGEPPAVSLAEWARALDEWARAQGYTGPRPPA